MPVRGRARAGSVNHTLPVPNGPPSHLDRSTPGQPGNVTRSRGGATSTRCSGTPPAPFPHMAQKWGHRRPFQWGQKNPLKTIALTSATLACRAATPRRSTAKPCGSGLGSASSGSRPGSCRASRSQSCRPWTYAGPNGAAPRPTRTSLPPWPPGACRPGRASPYGRRALNGVPAGLASVAACPAKTPATRCVFPWPVHGLEHTIGALATCSRVIPF